MNTQFNVKKGEMKSKIDNLRADGIKKEATIERASQEITCLNNNISTF